MEGRIDKGIIRCCYVFFIPCLGSSPSKHSSSRLFSRISSSIDSRARAKEHVSPGRRHTIIFKECGEKTKTVRAFLEIPGCGQKDLGELDRMGDFNPKYGAAPALSIVPETVTNSSAGTTTYGQKRARLLLEYRGAGFGLRLERCKKAPQDAQASTSAPSQPSVKKTH